MHSWFQWNWFVCVNLSLQLPRNLIYQSMILLSQTQERPGIEPFLLHKSCYKSPTIANLWYIWKFYATKNACPSIPLYHLWAWSFGVKFWSWLHNAQRNVPCTIMASKMQSRAWISDFGASAQVLCVQNSIVPCVPRMISSLGLRKFIWALVERCQMQEWDLVIVGAGIAGSALAHSQAQVALCRILLLAIPNFFEIPAMSHAELITSWA